MTSDDARRETLTRLHERRKQVVRMHREGLRVMQIVKLTGLSYPAVRKTIDRFAIGGAAAIAPAPRGRRTGQGRRLTAEQEMALRTSICGRRPDPLPTGSSLWNRAAVAALIEKEYGVALSVRAVDSYVARWGFAPLPPFDRDYVSRTRAGRQWLEEHYPAIEARARNEGGEIRWSTLRPLGAFDPTGRSGAAGVLSEAGAAWEPDDSAAMSVVSHRSRRGELNWMVIVGAVNHPRKVEVLDAMAEVARRIGRKIFLILDGPAFHCSKVLRAWLAKNNQHLETFELPDFGRTAALRGPHAVGAARTNERAISSRRASRAKSTPPISTAILSPYPGAVASMPAPFTQDARVLNAIAECDGDPNFVTGLARGLAILLALADRKQYMNISQISRRTGIPRAAARRGLYTLARLGFVSADQVRGFSLRPTVLTFSHAYLSASPLATLAQPILDRLGEQVQEACSVAVLDGDEIVYIARSASSKLITSALKVGHRLPAFCTSIGLVMLAHSPSKDLDRYFERARFHPYTEFTPTSESDIRTILKGVFDEGYAFASQQMELRFCSIAVPIRDGNGRFVAGMNVILQGRLLSEDKIVARYLKPLSDAARELGTLLVS